MNRHLIHTTAGRLPDMKQSNDSELANALRPQDTADLVGGFKKREASTSGTAVTKRQDVQIIQDKPTQAHIRLVPQSPYIAPNTFLFNKQAPIQFARPGSLGISCREALRRSVPQEWKTEFIVQLSYTSSKISCRINWPGYDPHGKAINVRDDTRDRKPIAKSKLAYNIAKVVMWSIRENSNRMQSVGGYEDWVVGECFNASNIIIAELAHMSEGSWQPKLFYVP